MLKSLTPVRRENRPRVRGPNRGNLPSRGTSPQPQPRPQSASPNEKEEIPPIKEPQGGFDEEAYFINKQNKEKYLAEKAKIDAEAKRTKHAENIGTLVRADAAQRMLENEHQKWLDAIDDWRQEILKRMGKLGIPVETQEAISDMIQKQTVAMRQKRAVA